MYNSNKLIKIKKIRKKRYRSQNRKGNLAAVMKKTPPKAEKDNILTSEKMYLSQNGNKKFKDIAELWKIYIKISLKDSTYLKYCNLIEKHILPELGELYIEQINSVFLADFMNMKLTSGRIDKQGGLSPSYVKSIMIIILEIINFSIEEGYSLPVKIKLHLPKNEKSKLCVLDWETQQQLEQYLLSNLNATGLGILLSLNTGLRIGEICALKWSDIDFDNAVLHVNTTVARVKSDDGIRNFSKLIIDKPKTKSSIREIPIVSRIFEPLAVIYQLHSSEYVISTDKSFVSPRTFAYRFHSVLKKCEIPQVNFHVLRHTFATRCIEGGVDVKSLSEILGHANVSVTLNTYVHSSIERKRKLMEKIVFEKSE